MRIGLSLILVLASPLATAADSHQPLDGQDPPSAALLEFLGDLEPVDDETWQLLEQHALKDLAKNKEVNSE